MRVVDMGYRRSFSSRTTRGYLLLELVLAMVFISVALVGILGGFGASIRAHGANESLSLGLLLLEGKAGELQSGRGLWEGFEEGEFEGHPGFLWETEIEETEVTGLFRARLAVSWGDDSRELVLYLRGR